MEAVVRGTPDSVSAARPPEGAKAPSGGSAVGQHLQACGGEPWAYDYFALMRRLESIAAGSPRWGRALLPSAEPVRVGQEPSLSFAPASFSRFEPAGAHSPPRLRQHFFGYLGPNGPLPVHLSDFIRERTINHGDPTWLAFLDTFSHRFSLFFYRAWAQARPAVGLDRPQEDGFRRQVGALVGIGTPARQQRDEVHDDARLHFSGRLLRQVHNAEGVEAVLASYFGVPVRLEPWIGHWMPLPEEELTRLGSCQPSNVGGSRRYRSAGQGATTSHSLCYGEEEQRRHALREQASDRHLGVDTTLSRGEASRSLGLGAMLGRRAWDRQHRVRLHLGPLDFEQYRMFLPTGDGRPALRRWMQQLLGDELYWDAELILQKEALPPARLGTLKGNAPRLGWVSWLGRERRARDAADVRIDGDAPVPRTALR